MVSFKELEQITSQFVWKYKKPQIAKVVLRKKNGTGGINLPDFRLYYKVTVIKYSMVLAQRQKYRPMEQNRKARDKSTHLGTPYFDKGGKNIQWRISTFDWSSGCRGRMESDECDSSG